MRAGRDIEAEVGRGVLQAVRVRGGKPGHCADKDRGHRREGHGYGYRGTLRRLIDVLSCARGMDGGRDHRKEGSHDGHRDECLSNPEEQVHTDELGDQRAERDLGRSAQ